jgi:hypothetical protein
MNLTGSEVEVDPVVRDDRAELLCDRPQFKNWWRCFWHLA